MQPVSVKSVDKSSANVNKEDIDELNELQDDEIRKDSSKIDMLFYRDGVSKLTDETFNATLMKEDLLAVLFFAEFDSKSILMQPLFSKVNDAICKIFCILCCCFIDQIQKFKVWSNFNFITNPHS